MDFLLSLWLPIVVSGVVLFFASAMAWMLLPHHFSDWKKLANEDEFIRIIKETGIPEGRYMFPNAGSHQASQKEEFQRKMKDSPVGNITVLGKINMGRNMLLTFVFFLVSSALIAYLAWFAMANSNPTFMHVFRFVGTAAILTHSCSSIPNDIWFKRPMWTNLADGIAYGLLTGLIFAALWPGK